MVHAFIAMLFVLFGSSAASVAAELPPRPAPPVTRDAELCSATPSDARLDIYPLASRRLSEYQGAGLGLRPVFLDRPLEAFNHHREIGARHCAGTWVPEVILAGTLVWVDADGYIAYKGDCGNRLVRKPAPAVASRPNPPAEPRARARWLWRSLGDLLAWPFVYYE